MSDVKVIELLFQTRPIQVYGPYVSRDGYTGYDVDLSGQVARVLKRTELHTVKCPSVIVQIDGFEKESQARDWLNSIMVDDDFIDEDIIHGTWTAIQRFEGMDLETLLVLYPESNPLFPKVLRRSR